MNENVDLKAAVEEGIKEAPTDDVEVTWTQGEADEAEAMGWIPPDRSKRLPEGKKFLAPTEYMERNPLYRQMKDLKGSFDQLNSHYQKVTEVERVKAEKSAQKQIETLMAEKVKALDDDDHTRVVEIDEKIRKTEKPEEVQQEDPLFTKWKSENSWYDGDRFLTTEADLIGRQLMSPNLVGIDLFDAVKEHLQQKYPEKFSNKKRERASSVESGSNYSSPKSKSVTEKDLSSDERIVFNNFKRMGTFAVEGSEQKYLTDVIAVRD